MKKIVGFVNLVLLAVASVSGQQQGPVTPPPKRDIKVIPLDKAPEPPPMPVDEMLRRITEHENETIRARNASTYQVALRLQEFNSDGETSGEFQMATDMLFGPDGKPYEKVVRKSQSSLVTLTGPSEELAEYGHVRPFMLPTLALDYYELTYGGKQQLDELNTYMFQIRPKRLDRTHKYFRGAIWVEDRDFAIVKAYGQWVSELDSKSDTPPFEFFESYRENVKGNLWFPSFVRSEENLDAKAGPARIRLTVRFTDYKLNAAPPIAPESKPKPPDAKPNFFPNP